MANLLFFFRFNKTGIAGLPFFFSGDFLFLFSFLTLFLFIVNSMALTPQITDDDWYYLGFEIDGVNGSISDIVFKDSCVYVSGDFTAAGSVMAQNIAKWDGHRWHSLGTRSEGLTRIVALCIDSSGNLIAGGVFDSIGGVVSYNIAKWNGKNWQPLNDYPNNESKRRIRVLACDANGNIYAGGEFDTIGGIRAVNIARWDGKKWDSLGAGLSGPKPNDCFIDEIDFDLHGNVYVSGSFIDAGDIKSQNIAKWDGTSWGSLGEGLPVTIKSIACDFSGNVFAGVHDSILKWDGEKWSRFTTVIGYVNSLKFDKQNKLYLCGNFTMNEGVKAKSIAIWDGLVWSSPFPFDADDYVNLSAIDNSGNIYAGGTSFDQIYDIYASNIMKWNGASWSALGQRVCAVTYSNNRHAINDMVVVNDKEIFVCGLSNLGYPSSYLSRWDGEIWNFFEPPLVEGDAQAVCRDRSGNVYVAGKLDERFVGRKYGNIAKWDGSNWHTLGTGINGKIFALATDNKGILYAGGVFDTAGEELATCIAAWDGQKWSRLKAGMYNKNDTVFALACNKEGKLFAGGRFSFAGEATANNIAMWDGKSWNSLGSGLGDYQSSRVYALAFDEHDNLYVGGSFRTIGGLPAKNLAFWDGTQWHPMNSYVNDKINAIACDKIGNVYIGHERDLNGSSLWKWDGNEWSSLGFGTRKGGVRVLKIHDSTLYVGGKFHTAGNNYSPLFAKVNIHTMGFTKSSPVVVSDAVPKISFYMQNSTLFLRDIKTEDIIFIYSLSGRILRQHQGVSEIKLQGIVRQPFVLCVRRSGVDLIRTIMVKM